MVTVTPGPHRRCAASQRKLTAQPLPLSLPPRLSRPTSRPSRGLTLPRKPTSGSALRPLGEAALPAGWRAAPHPSPAPHARLRMATGATPSQTGQQMHSVTRQHAGGLCGELPTQRAQRCPALSPRAWRGTAQPHEPGCYSAPCNVHDYAAIGSRREPTGGRSNQARSRSPARSQQIPAESRPAAGKRSATAAKRTRTA